MRTTILTHVEREGASETDAVVGQVLAALRQNGHAVSVLKVHSDLEHLLTELRSQAPELVFNLLESFGDDIIGGLVGVAGVLDLLQLRYTGGGPGELYLQEDKGLSKKLLAYEGIKYPKFAIFSPGAEFETGGRLRLPMFVKPARNEASLGIDAQRSLVRTVEELMDRIATIHREFGDAALAEEYIEGREFYIGVLGNQDPLAFPPIEMDFSGLPPDHPRVMDNAAKFDENSAAYNGTHPVIAELDDQLTAQLQKVALDACRVLRVRDYGRVDVRLAPTGDIYVLEVNGNCYLEEHGEFAMAAHAAGRDYPSLIREIVTLAVARGGRRSTREALAGSARQGCSG